MKAIYIIRTTWFYFLYFLGVIINYPFLIKMKNGPKHFKRFFFFKKITSFFPLYFSGFYPKKMGKEQAIEGPVIYIANHSSMMDIPLVCLTANKTFAFIGKKELTKFPIFGSAYAAMAILVDRSNPRSGIKSLIEADLKIKDGISIVLFAEGGVPKDHTIKLDSFKNGAFSLAIKNQAPIIPISLPDNKKCFPYTSNRPIGRPIGPLRAVFHDPIETKGMNVKDDLENLKQQVWDILEQSL